MMHLPLPWPCLHHCQLDHKIETNQANKGAFLKTNELKVWTFSKTPKIQEARSSCFRLDAKRDDDRFIRRPRWPPVCGNGWGGNGVAKTAWQCQIHGADKNPIRWVRWPLSARFRSSLFCWSGVVRHLRQKERDSDRCSEGSTTSQVLCRVNQ